MLIHVKSNRLAEVLEKVRIQHPIKKGENLGLKESIVDEVRSLLERSDIKGLSKLAFQFDPSKLVACIDIVAIDKTGEIAEKAAQVALLRPRDSMIIRCWFKLTISYPNPLLEKLLKDLVGMRSYGVLEQHANISKHLPQWLLAAELSMGIIRDYQSTPYIKKLDQFLADHFLNREDAIFKSVWLTLLTKGNAAEIKRQYPKRILDEINDRQRASESRLIGQYYLNTLNGMTDWSDIILEHIHKKWGKPHKQSDIKSVGHRFWDDIKEPAKEAFRRWLMLAEVESFFEGDRADFWRNYVIAAKVQEVTQILAGEGFMLDFGHFGVVEFKNVGNASYIYPRDIFKKYWKGAGFWVDSPVSFKDKTQTVRSKKLPTWDGRILHHSGWQSTARERINILMDEK